MKINLRLIINCSYNKTYIVSFAININIYFEEQFI